MSEKRVLIIEDDMDAADVLEAYLQRERFQVAIAADGLKGLDMAQRWRPDLVLLDVMLPGLSGTDVLSRLRKKSDVPVIMVTAMGDVPDRIGALRYGADDYIIKPYNPGEVVARVHAVLRRCAGSVKPATILSFGTLRLDMDALVVTGGDEQDNPSVIDLTPTELNLLAIFLQAPTRAFSRQVLLEHCLPESDALERVVDTHVYNLRKKLEAVGIIGVLQTVRAVGYRFTQP